MQIPLNKITYNTKQIKTIFDTEIGEFLNDETYNYNPGPELKLTYPIGGEKFYTKGTINITWASELADKIPLSKLQYSLDSKTWADITPGYIQSSTNAYNWAIPESQALSKNYTVKIVASGSYDGQAISNTVKEPFEINTKYIKIQPLGKIDITANISQIVNIKWKANEISEYIKIVLIDSMSERYIIEDKYFTDGGTVYSWIVNGLQPVNHGKMTARLVLYDAADESVYSSGDPIEITTPVVYNVVIDELTNNGAAIPILQRRGEAL